MRRQLERREGRLPWQVGRLPLFTRACSNMTRARERLCIIPHYGRDMGIHSFNTGLYWIGSLSSLPAPLQCCLKSFSNNGCAHFPAENIANANSKQTDGRTDHILLPPPRSSSSLSQPQRHRETACRERESLRGGITRRLESETLPSLPPSLTAVVILLGKCTHGDIERISSLW